MYVRLRSLDVSLDLLGLGRTEDDDFLDSSARQTLQSPFQKRDVRQGEKALQETGRESNLISFCEFIYEGD